LQDLALVLCIIPIVLTVFIDFGGHFYCPDKKAFWIVVTIASKVFLFYQQVI